jgi:hypothetical protein
MSYFEESPKLDKCPNCHTNEWPYQGDDENAQRFFMCLWKEMAKDIESYDKHFLK